VFGAKKKMQIGIQAGIPFLPAMLPVGPSEIAGVVAKDFKWLGAISLGLGVKNELGLAGRRKSGVLGGRRSRWGTFIHWREGRGSGTPAHLPAWRHHLTEGVLVCWKNAFAWDYNQTLINDKRHAETGEDFPVRKGTRGGTPETSNVARCGGTDKSSRQNNRQELLELRAKRQQLHVAAAFLLHGLRWDQALRVNSDVSCWCSLRKSAWTATMFFTSRGYYPL